LTTLCRIFTERQAPRLQCYNVLTVSSAEGAGDGACRTLRRNGEV
jgi:hypothetical protein